jgi:ubiquitin-like 1-activating enzyme E1 B
MGRDSFAVQSLGGSLHERVKNTRVLMVGAGGIGCELLKNLVLMNFGEVHVVDLDTIDLSNLNRQFLFRHEHIKQPKAVIAKETATKFNPAVKITAYHANIKDAEFSKSWFRQFDMVFNALDNMDARRYVNTMCIALDIPLVESGTTGFRGQASVIKRGITECYECTPKETPKSFPVCTIRSTPSQPIHCIVWSKSYLLAEVFGEGSNDAKELDFSAEDNNTEELNDIRKETEALKKIRTSIGTEEFPKLVFDKVFTKDIEVLRSMTERWNKARPAPTALHFTDLQSQSLDGLQSTSRDQSVWTLLECFAVFVDSLKRLATRKTQSKDSVIEFDKDDDDTLEFVSAAANLRSYIFGIEPKSKFDIKQMAGNIIPAIATTNAIIAGSCVLQAYKILRGEYPKAKKWYMWQSIDRVMASTFDGPNPECPVCSVIRTDVSFTSQATLGDLVTALEEIGYEEDFSILANDQLIFEQGDEDFEENLEKTLSSFELGSFIAIKCDDKEDLVLSVEESLSEENSETPENSLTLKAIAVPTKKAAKEEQAAPTSPPLVLRTNGAVNKEKSSKKRSAEDDLEREPPVKKVQTGEIFVLDDDGAIVFD